MSSDRNFDDLAERFSKRIYGSLKGQIRQQVIWRDLTQHTPNISSSPLRVLDIGGGLGQFAIKLAELGHQVTYNDISIEMTKKAQEFAAQTKVNDVIQWFSCPYQQLIKEPLAPYDIVLCHAVLEWLQEPEQIIPAINHLLKPKGVLSLCFYNPAGKIYRNLICGNFNFVNNMDKRPSDKGSLTPNNPCASEQVKDWLMHNDFSIQQESGIRVFHDYVREKRGGHQIPEEVLKMELLFSNQTPYKQMGRYLHILANKN